jgi:CspA family cold shock protein
MKGTVRDFNNLKGFGFIVSPQLKDDIFVHFSQVKQDGYKYLQPGDIVEFELGKTGKGFSAKNVMLKIQEGSTLNYWGYQFESINNEYEGICSSIDGFPFNETVRFLRKLGYIEPRITRYEEISKKEFDLLIGAAFVVQGPFYDL